MRNESAATESCRGLLNCAAYRKRLPDGIELFLVQDNLQDTAQDTAWTSNMHANVHMRLHASGAAFSAMPTAQSAKA